MTKPSAEAITPSPDPRKKRRTRENPRTTPTTSGSLFHFGRSPSATTTRTRRTSTGCARASEPPRPRVRPLLRQLVGQLEPRQAQVPAHHRPSDPSPAACRYGHSDALSTLVGRRGDVRGGLHPRPLPGHHDAGGGARPHHVEPGADDDEDAAITRPVYLPEDDVRRMADYDEKLGVIAERYLDHDVRAVTGTTCWFTLLFEKVLAEARTRGRPRPHRQGGLAEPARALRRRRVGGARTCRSSATSWGGKTSHWSTRTTRPRAACTHRATSAAPAGCSCSRTGARSSSSSPSRSTGALATRVPLWAVERDRPYVIVSTTVSGLYAYSWATSFGSPRRPLRIEFMGRLSGCLSVTQELTTHVEIERAVEHAVKAVPCTTVDFGAAGDVGVDGTAKSRYLLFVEFQEGAAPADWTPLPPHSTKGCAENRVYREHQRGGGLPGAAWFPSQRAAHGASSEEVTRGNVQGSSPASSTIRRKSCFGSTRKARHESHRGRHRRSERSRRVDGDRRRRADEARTGPAHRHGHREDGRSDRRVDHRAARVRAARSPGLRRAGTCSSPTCTRARCTTRCCRRTCSTR
jgi:hypothetical protein